MASGKASGSMAKPHSEAGRLASSVRVREISHRTPLEAYFQTAEHFLREASVYRAEDNEKQLYIKLFTFVSLVLETLPKHSDWKKYRERNTEEVDRFVKLAVEVLDSEIPPLVRSINNRFALAEAAAAKGGVAVAAALPPSVLIPDSCPPRSWEQSSPSAPGGADAAAAAVEAQLSLRESDGVSAPADNDDDLPPLPPPSTFPLRPSSNASRAKHTLLPSADAEAGLWNPLPIPTGTPSPRPPPPPPPPPAYRPSSALLPPMLSAFNQGYSRAAAPSAPPAHTRLPSQALVDVLQSDPTPRPPPRVGVRAPSAEDAMSDHARLHSRLQLYGLSEKRIEGDGNCQFRALADQLWRDQGRHAEVRSRVMACMRREPDAYSVFVCDEPFSAYLQRMSAPGAWGDHLTLQAAADAFQVKLCLLTSYRDSFVLEIVPRQGQAQRTLWLSFFAEVHYNSLYSA